MKYFRMSYDEVVFRRSYVNIMLLNRSIPSFKFKDDDEENNNGSTYSRRKKQAEGIKHTIPKNMHANSFFEQLM
jgi:hypothetical protein